MAGTPNHSYVINQMATEPQWRDCLVTNTGASISQFLQEAAVRLCNHDPEWGYLGCSHSEPHITLPTGAYVANDACAYRASHEAVDVLSNASSETMTLAGEARPQWTVRAMSGGEWLEVAPMSSSGDSAKLEELEQRIKNLELNAILFGQTVALQADGGLGQYLCAQNGGPDTVDERFDLRGRTTVGPWESWKTRKGTGEGTVG